MDEKTVGKYLDRLNKEQRDAVMTTDGPLLVLAGAGSGKTTVLSSRVAYILQTTYAAPWNILAITFTNKAAEEMRSRIQGIIGSNANEMWIGTFHSVCARMLRTCIEYEKYGKDFVIYDSADTETLIKECLKQLGYNVSDVAPRGIRAEISKAKSNMMMPEDYIEKMSVNPHTKIVAEVYELYRKKLLSNNAVDFDDLIMLTVKILREHEDVARYYQEKFQYILVDEYQDTNNSQYGLIGLLAAGYGNICVVGDDDQSIYKFRGANIQNILDFPRDYPTAKVVKLEQNYRSTRNIINAANYVIANNGGRMDKQMRTDRSDGEPITVFIGRDERDEAEFVADEIMRHGSYGDCAVLYRMNSQSRAVEEVLMKRKIPYRVLAGMRFYDRKEIKDMIAYLRVIFNPHDDLSLARIINEPKRKIGEATVEKIQKCAAQNNISCFDVIDDVKLYPTLHSAAVRLTKFAEMIKNLRKAATTEDVYSVACRVANDTGYRGALEKEDTVEAKTRLDNIDEFLGRVQEFVKDASNDGTLSGFLEGIALVSDTDNYDENEPSVTLMTIHSAKGLEFPIVFLTGLEEDILPSHNSSGITTIEDLEEERRLCYVAMTRAKDKLYMSRAYSRFKNGFRAPHAPSRFLEEIPDEYKTDAEAATRKVMEKMGVGRLGKMKNKTAKERNNPPAAMKDIAVGERVRHKVNGEGTVISSMSFGSNALLTIRFDDVGEKKLMIPFTKLERI